MKGVSKVLVLENDLVEEIVCLIDLRNETVFQELVC
jgi:hypothetical protein